MEMILPTITNQFRSLKVASITAVITKSMAAMSVYQ